MPLPPFDDKISKNSALQSYMFCLDIVIILSNLLFCINSFVFNFKFLIIITYIKN